jgi:hypothetical protein
MTSTHRDRPDSEIVCRMLWLSRARPAFSASTGILARLGWKYESVWLAGIRRNLATMKPSTALALAVSAFLWPPQNNPRSWWKSRVSYALAAVVIVIGTITVFELLSGWSLGINPSVRRLPGTSSAADRMAPNTAICVALIGLSSFLIEASILLQFLSQSPALLAGLVSLSELVGYTYSIQPMYGSPGFGSMALPAEFRSSVQALVSQRHSVRTVLRVPSCGVCSTRVGRAAERWQRISSRNQLYPFRYRRRTSHFEHDS